jgi:hypothetical protein
VPSMKAWARSGCGPGHRTAARRCPVHVQAESLGELALGLLDSDPAVQGALQVLAEDLAAPGAALWQQVDGDTSARAQSYAATLSEHERARNALHAAALKAWQAGWRPATISERTGLTTSYLRRLRIHGRLLPCSALRSRLP